MQSHLTPNHFWEFAALAHEIRQPLSFTCQPSDPGGSTHEQRGEEEGHHNDSRMCTEHVYGHSARKRGRVYGRKARVCAL